MRCESAGCPTRAVWEIGKQSRRKQVCSDCRDYHIEWDGWEIKRSLFNKAREAT